MKKGSRVCWQSDLAESFHGEVITDEGDGHVIVALDDADNEGRRMVYCAVSVLSAEEVEEAPKECPAPEAGESEAK